MTADALAAASHYVYRLRDAEGVLLYVGCSRDPATRLLAHESDQPWGHLIHSQDVEGPFDRDVALARETAAISSERPRFNIRHNPAPERWERRPSTEAIHFVQRRVSLAARDVMRAFWTGALPLEPTEADVWLWLRTVDTRFHRTPCYRSCRCGNYWSDVMYLAEDHRRAEEQRFLREQQEQVA